MNASALWLRSTGERFAGRMGRRSCAQLTHYTAEFEEWGEGPPIVLVPGLAGGYRLLGPVARLLARHYRVISYHLRGEDDPFALRRQFGLSNLVDDLAEFLDWHCLENPTIFGLSFGGIIAVEFAARYRHRVKSLILQGVGARYERTLIQRIAGLVLSRFPLPKDNPFVNQFFNLLFGGKHHSKELFRFVVRQCWRTDQSVMAHRFQMVETYNALRRLNRINVPTLILSGNRDLLVSPSSLYALHEGIAHSVLTRLPTAGHLGFVTQPERVAWEVVRFLQAQNG